MNQTSKDELFVSVGFVVLADLPFCGIVACCWEVDEVPQLLTTSLIVPNFTVSLLTSAKKVLKVPN